MAGKKTFDDMDLLKSDQSIKEMENKLKKGANPNTNDNGETPLLVCVKQADDNTLVGKVKVLLGHPMTNPNIFNNYGDSPLFSLLDRLTRNKDLSLEVLHMFLQDERTDLSLKDSQKRTPLLWCCEYMNSYSTYRTDIFEAFVKTKRVDVNSFGYDSDDTLLSKLFYNFEHIKEQQFCLN